MIDVILLAVIAIVTWCLSGEGGWGSVFIFFSVLFAGILATNFFEPLANFLEGALLSQGVWRMRADFIAFSLLFAIFITLFRMIAEYITPTYMHTDGIVHDVTRWTVGLMTGYLTAGILLFSLHTAALPREFLGFKAERKNFFNMLAPDRQWMAYMQYISEFSFSHGSNLRVFDGPEYAIIPGQKPEMWSSFPIKYADRRGQLGSGTAAAPSPADSFVPIPSATPSPAPNSDGGGGPAF